MQIHETSYPRTAATLPTEQLRAEFLVSGLFAPGAANFRYWETDRTIVGGITPGASPLDLPNPAEVRSAFFLERREAGVINLGGPGSMTVDGTVHAMESLDTLYLGRGVKAVSFTSRSADTPARFYFLSYPAHTAYPVRHIPVKDVAGARLGARETADLDLNHHGASAARRRTPGWRRPDPTPPRAPSRRAQRPHLAPHGARRRRATSRRSRQSRVCQPVSAG